MNNSSHNHLRWTGVKNVVASPAYRTYPSGLLSYNHSQAQLPGPTVSQSSSLATLTRELTKIHPGFNPQTTNSLHTQPPLHQHQPVHNVLRMEMADPLYTLALPAEQERLLAESAQRVYMHQRTISEHRRNHQSFINQVQQFGHASWGCSSFRSTPLESTRGSAALKETLPMVDVQKEQKTLPMGVTEPTPAVLSTKVPVESDQTLKDNDMRRKVGRIRYFDKLSGSYGPWKDIVGGRLGDTQNSATITLNLSRGGTLRILCNVLPENKRKDLSRAMHDCKLYRQYSISRNDRLNFDGFQEPRSHVLLSSRAKTTIDDDDETSHDERRHQPGYAYHGIKMKALPIDLVPEVASYAEELARTYNLPHWDIGVDMIAYKDGGDSIGWHADDTQGETVVVCVVVDAPGEIRPLCIRPNKRTKPLCHGDEEIQLFIAEGDGYDMDGYMQDNYEHSLPKKLKSNSHRFVLIFRHGNTGFVPQDSGVSVLKKGGDESISGEEWNVVSAITKLRPKTETVVFGHPTNVSMGECYSRRFLWSTFSHRADQRGINGNIKDGSDSIVVSRQDFDVREEDGLSWLRYTSSRRQGAGALYMSFRMKKPVRVFRSSNLKSSYRPAAFEGDRTSYRYDGLYIVTHVWNSEGNLTDGGSGKVEGGVHFTFHLERLPHPDNPMTIDDLFWKIQQSHCFGPHLPFRPPQPKNGGDVLPAFTQNVDQPVATAESTLIHQQRSQLAFLQPLSINKGARIELERLTASTIVQETEGFMSKLHVARKSKEVKKKKEEKKATTRLARLPTDIVDAIFACVLENKSLPKIDFQILVTEDTKLSPPPFDYKDGIYVLVDTEFPIPQTLSDRVVSHKTLDLMNGRWSIGGAQTLNLTNSLSNFRKRSMCPKGRDVSTSNFGKRGALYTLIGSTGVDCCDCKIVHVHHSNAEKAPQVSSSPKKKTPKPVIFTVKEPVYAYDKSKSGDVLYEAQVIKMKEDTTGCLKYWVQYKGYKKSHNKWLPSDEIMKQTKLNRAKYLKSRSQLSLTSKPSTTTKTTTPSTSKRKPSEKTKVQASTVCKSTKKRKRCSGSDIDSERVENKRKRQPSPMRRSARCVQTFNLTEKVFAPDKNKSGDVLYEATVIKLKEDAAGCLKYLVQYKGYKKSHNKWLGAEELMKQTKQNRARFEKSRMCYQCMII